MAKPIGAKNKPKTYSQLVGLLETAAEAEGIVIEQDVMQKIQKAAEAPNWEEMSRRVIEAEKIKERSMRGKKARAEEKKAIAALSKQRPKSEESEEAAALELELDKTEVDTFICGNCKNSMGAEMADCPNCGVKLSW